MRLATLIDEATAAMRLFTALVLWETVSTLRAISVVAAPCCSTAAAIAVVVSLMRLMVHARIGLEPRWYIAAYHRTLSHLIRRAVIACYSRVHAHRATVELGDIVAVAGTLRDDVVRFAVVREDVHSDLRRFKVFRQMLFHRFTCLIER